MRKLFLYTLLLILSVNSFSDAYAYSTSTVLTKK